MTKSLSARPRPGFATFEPEPRRDYLDADGEIDFVALQASPDFQRLRRRAVRFALPATVLFLVWYLTYVLLSAYAPGFMSQPVFGAVNVGLLFGMLQFVSTVVITLLYGRYAKRRVDPEVDAVRALVDQR
ncbi:MULTISPECIES: DUF485 domain-containing protein [Actinokineospora]|uniref:DUF485 domain-containing protein n=1 Tax=Actinokineospora fastidiosa TaxID=1816 RepID=A0A918LCZ0_9PSEU|nr:MULTISPECIES: DUF485 domain-containing protein [Actinokineospora]UVS79772.1 hypothetical protein Actkin_03522 [Actinokineospora sp. UTMC 2448]GGS30839.1 hypothetical protein GCM10010171_25640 [Actinokineospora fastidiosa]